MNGYFRFHYDESLDSEVWPTLYASASAPLRLAFFKGQPHLLAAGVPGFDYSVQVSPDLRNWTPLSTNTAPFEFVDPEPPTHNQRFYRAVTVP
jgi:hypothetical protein